MSLKKWCLLFVFDRAVFLAFPDAFGQYLDIDGLPVDWLAFGLQLFDHSLHHPLLYDLSLGYRPSGLPLAMSNRLTENRFHY